MNNWDSISNCLKIIGAKQPNVLFIGGDVTKEYLLFYECFSEDRDLRKEAELKRYNCFYVGKYEAYGIEREYLWDNRNK